MRVYQPPQKVKLQQLTFDNTVSISMSYVKQPDQSLSQDKVLALERLANLLNKKVQVDPKVLTMKVLVKRVEAGKAQMLGLKKLAGVTKR